MSTMLSTDRTEKMLWWLALGGAAVSLILGIMMLVWPQATLYVGAILFGLWLLFHGAINLVNAITAHAADGTSRALNAVIGVLFVIAGVICLRHLVLSLLVIATLIGVAWLVGGIVGLVEAFAGHRTGPARVLVGVLGGVTVLGGLIVLIWPGPSLKTLVVLTGIWLLLMGALQLFLVLRARPGASLPA
ncbi:HdeD family acid-resistance protein [Actinoplanes sp. CA-142083]|uniref:HdeD family acid-resistance protein n=1 Tax=Actinoplanes sp. CA-142083 TaxID=3239903 RepID=UPI003D8CAEB8